MFQAQLDCFDGLAHVSELHKGGSCSIQHVIDGEWFEGLSKPFNQIVEELNLIGEHSLSDTYITQQSILPFKRRSIETVYKLSSYWVDLDCYNVGLTKEQALTESLKIISDKSLPKPRMIADSGRGLYLVWLLARPISTKKNVKNRHERLAAWQRTENLLIDTFASVGADPRACDPARVLRLAGSVNSKSETQVKYWLSGNKLKSFDELSNALTAIQPDIKPKNNPAKAYTPRKAIYAGNRILNRFTLASCRMADIKSLAGIRGGRLTDHRERAIYIYSVEAAYFCRERETLLNTVGEFMSEYLNLDDNKYNPSTPEKYIKSVLDKCELVNYLKATFSDDARYKQRTSTIIKWLDITEAEQQAMKTVIGDVEKYRRKKIKRKSDGVRSRKQYLVDEKTKVDSKVNQAISMREQGFSVNQIVKELKVTERTVYRYFKG